MKNSMKALLVASMLTLSMTMTALASEPKSLDELTAGSSVTTETAVDNTQQGQTGGQTSSPLSTEPEFTNRDFIDGLSGAVQLTTETKVSSDFSKTANYYGSIIFQYLATIVSVGVLVMVGIDMVFILLPFTRGLLGGGAAGAMAQGGQQGAGMAGGVAGGMAGGMGGMSGGMGGMSGGYGMHRSPMAGRGRMMNQQGQQGGGLGGRQIVSDAAIQAVAMSAQNNGTALVAYIKTMSVTIVLAGVVLVLAGTGVLSTLGLALGSKISSLLRGFISGLA